MLNCQMNMFLTCSSSILINGKMFEKQIPHDTASWLVLESSSFIGSTEGTRLSTLTFEIRFEESVCPCDPRNEARLSPDSVTLLSDSEPTGHFFNIRCKLILSAPPPLNTASFSNLQTFYTFQVPSLS